MAHTGPCIFVYQPGTVVRVCLGDAESTVKGVIIQVSIRGGLDTIASPHYQVSWWNGSERACEWLEKSEFVTTLKPSLRVGFLPSPGDL